MRDEKYTDRRLIFIQSISWYLAFVLFGVVTFLFFLKNEFAPAAAKAGVVMILTLTLLKIFVMAEKFRMIKLSRLVVLSYILIVILLSTVLIKFLL